MEPDMELEEEPEVRPEDLKEYEKHLRFHKPHDVRVFTRTPMGSLLARERRDLLKKKMRRLQGVVEKRLKIREVAFFRQMFGHKWGERLRLPSMEFAGYLPDLVDGMLPVLQERVGILLENMPNYDAREEVFSMAARPYFLTTEEETLDIYGKVLNNGHRFPVGFFRGDYGRKAGIVTRHMYETFKEMTPAEAMEQAMRRDFREFKLGTMLKTRFQDSAQTAVQNAYPQHKYPDLYGAKEGKIGTVGEVANLGGLSHLVDSIDDLFNEKARE